MLNCMTTTKPDTAPRLLPFWHLSVLNVCDSLKVFFSCLCPFFEFAVKQIGRKTSWIKHSIVHFDCAHRTWLWLVSSWSALVKGKLMGTWDTVHLFTFAKRFYISKLSKQYKTHIVSCRFYRCGTPVTITFHINIDNSLYNFNLCIGFGKDRLV